MHNDTRALAFVASLVMLTVALPARAADPPPFGWLGVTIGEPVASLRQTLGDPLLVTNYNDSGPPYREARYVIEGTQAYLIVTERWGRVTAVRAVLFEPPAGPLAMPPDPSGLVLGQTAEEVGAKHPNARRRVDGDWLWLYESVGGQRGLAVLYKFFLAGRLQSAGYFLLAVPDDKATPPPDALPGLTEPAGDSFETAIADMQKNENDGVAWEYQYVALHPCGPNQRWQTKQQSLQNHANRVYDVLHVVCPATNAERNYFFDITAYFGKL